MPGGPSGVPVMQAVMSGTPVTITGAGAEVMLAVGVRLGAAAVAGAILGLDRDLRHKPAGLRVHALVALGAALVTVVGVQLASAGRAMDPTSVTGVVGGAVAAVGFLGGGVIVRGQDEPGAGPGRGGAAAGGRVHGLTTAASIWMAACLGIAAGVGLWPALLGGGVVTLAVLVGGASLERAVHRRLHPHAEAALFGPTDVGPRPASRPPE